MRPNFGDGELISLIVKCEEFVKETLGQTLYWGYHRDVLLTMEVVKKAFEKIANILSEDTMKQTGSPFRHSRT
jgi:hypothetical protein